jgi:hypothetical protein
MHAYGQIYVHDGSTAQALTSTPVLLTGFATLGPNSAARDGDQAATPTLASDVVAVKAGGIYRVTFNISAAFSAAAIVQIHARLGSTEIPYIAAQQDVVTTSGVDKYFTYAATGIYVPSADGNIGLYGETSGNGNLTPCHGSLLVERVG